MITAEALKGVLASLTRSKKYRDFDVTYSNRKTKKRLGYYVRGRDKGHIIIYVKNQNMTLRGDKALVGVGIHEFTHHVTLTSRVSKRMTYFFTGKYKSHSRMFWMWAGIMVERARSKGIDVDLRDVCY